MGEMGFVVSTCGYGSFGDDCAMETLRAELQAVWPSSTIAIHRWDDEAEFLPEEQESVVLGGGGWLYDFTYGPRTDNLQHYLRFPRAMQWFDKPTYALGVGVQGRLTREALAPWVDTLNGMGLRTVRDSVSATILRDAGVSEPVIESADLSYLIPLAQRPERERRRPVIGVAVSQPFRGVLHDEYRGFEDRVREALEQLHADFDFRFYSFDRRNEGPVSGRWSAAPACEAYVPDVPDAGTRFIQALGESDLLLTSRFHGVILSARMGIPFAALGVSGEKVEREAGALGSQAFRSYGATADAIAGAVRSAWEERGESAARIEQGVRRREELARKTFSALGNLEPSRLLGCPA